MSIFRPLLDILRPPRASSTPDVFEIPLNLSVSDFETLKTLVSSDEWEVFLRGLDALTKLEGEALLGASSVESSNFHRGYIIGLRKAATFVEEMKRMEQTWKHEQNQRNRLSRSDGDRRLALFGTSGWSNQHRQRDA